MLRYLPIIAMIVTNTLSAADFSGRWAGTLETNGSRVPIYFTLNEHDGKIGGSVTTGSLVPIDLAPNERGDRTDHFIVAGKVPVSIENGEVRNGELSFEVHDNANRLIQFRLTLVNGVLGGEATVGGEVSRVAVVQIGGGFGGRVAFEAIPVPGFGIGLGTGSGVGTGTAGSAGGGVFRVGGGVSAPLLIHKVEPEYTEEARAAKYQGTVSLYIEVGPVGTPTNIKVVRSLGLGLNEKAIECVKQWRFKPGMKDGRPVTVMATIEVNFRL